MLITVKALYKGDIKRFRNVPATFTGISIAIGQGFNIDIHRVLLRYCDESRDLCSLSQRTIVDALSFLDEEKTMRIYVLEKPEDWELAGACPQTIRGECQEEHDLIVCDGCEADPLRGDRYKCMICDNFDLCGSCMQSCDIGIVEHISRHRFRHVTNAKSPGLSPQVDDSWIHINSRPCQ